MRLKVYPARGLEGAVEAPPSKSYTHRALFAALLAEGVSRLENTLVSGDTSASLHAVRRLGARVSRDWNVEGTAGRPRSPPWIYCRGSGTTMRIAAAVSALTPGPVTLYGDRSLNRRPMAPLISALERLGAEVLSRGGRPPLAVKGPLRGGETEVDGSISSQFVTALLMVGPVVGVAVRVSGGLRSAPYIDVTLRVLEAFGARYEREGYRFFRVEPAGLRAARFRVPGDYSSAAFMLAAGALAGRVAVRGLDPEDVQGDRLIVDALKTMGAKVWVGDGVIEAESAGNLDPIEIDCTHTPDLVPVLAALAAHAKGVSRIAGVAHLVYKESNRLEALSHNLQRLGVEVRIGSDELVVRGGEVRGGVVDSFGDHRIAMAMAIAGLRARGPVEVRGAHKIPDSYPQFVDHLRSIGVRVEVLRG